MKNAKKGLGKNRCQKVSEKDAIKLYFDLITADITALGKSQNKGKYRTHNILIILKIFQPAFTCVYLNHFNKPSESDKKYH